MPIEVFAIAPAGARPLWVLLPVGLLLLVVFGVIVGSMRGARGARFEVSPGGPSVERRFLRALHPGREPAGGRRASRGSRGDTGLRPRLRTMGTGLPGYQAGWFRLANGEKALLYLTDRSKAVHVPTGLGYGLLLSPDDPDAFLSALKASSDRRPAANPCKRG